MLRLASATPAAWVELALQNLDVVLLDHAHCEKKAAGAAVQLLFRYPQRSFLLAPVAQLAREELEHFERVLGRLAVRGIAFQAQHPSPYGARLHAVVRAREPDRLLDRLLVSALIEARSCERFRLLAGALSGDALGDLYADLVASEARHYQVYLDLARKVAPSEAVDERLSALAEAEARILSEPAVLPRLHT